MDFDAMRALLGRRVLVTLDHYDPKARLTGILRSLDEEGECCVVDEQTCVATYGWPALAVQALGDSERGVVMSLTDKHELEWWRRVFSARFEPGGLPRVGSAMLAPRLRVGQQSKLDPDVFELIEWPRG